MINALFSSKPGGSKLFQHAEKAAFGWETINNLYERELKRVSQSQTRMVPRLKEAHCLRDAWTKLNVHPAKIMQVRHKVTIYDKMPRNFVGHSFWSWHIGAMHHNRVVV